VAEKVLITDWLPGSGEMAKRISAFDWSKTSIGSTDTWSPALRLMVRFLLANRFPLLLWWGSQYVSIYNDAYRPVLGTKHPRALGQPLSECWKEIWHVLRPLVDRPFTGGPATWNDDIVLEINRHGFVEETHFTIAYSPVPDETVPSGIGGVLATVHEITEKVVGERRVGALRDLGTPIGAKTAEEACVVAVDALARHAKDIPFALLYLIDADGKRARLASATGIDRGAPYSPTAIELGELASNDQQSWPLTDAARSERLLLVDDLAARFGAAVPAGPWHDPPRQAVVVPIRSNVAHQIAGFLVAGVSARLKFDELYRSFYELLAGQIGTAIVNARAYEEERKRAEALAEIDRAKTAFFSNASHEFRTPLTLILGPLEDTLLHSNDLPAADRERLETAQRNSRRLLKLVNTLLDFSRIEAGRIRASYEPTDLSALTAELASVFRSAIERGGLKLIVDCPLLPEAIYVDREMWEKIVLNLLSNAFKFTFEGEIEVSLRRSSAAAELMVRDTGVGIPPEEMPQLFERFHRVKGARGRSNEGSGIGLALVQELVKLHGGNVQVKSQVGQGTAFIVSIPLGKAHLPADRTGTMRTVASTSLRSETYVEEVVRWLPDVQRLRPRADESVAQLLNHQLSPPKGTPSTEERILLVDDNADMREYVSRLLTQAGYAVEAVADGVTALRSARKYKPNLVLTDVMMPGLDGFGLLRELRTDPRLAEMPIILLSARAGEEARIEGMRSGADDYLVKPFSGRDLLARVESHLKMARLREEANVAAKRLAAIVESSDDAIVSKDLNGVIMSWNAGAQRLFAYPAEEVLGKSITILIPSDRQDEETRILERIRRGERVDHYETVRCRKDGSLVDVSLTVSPIRDSAGTIIGASKIARDVTEQKQAEATRRLLLSELNHRVKNTLASVQAIVQQTLRSARDPAEFATGFAGRIQSLARVHALLTDATLKGADLGTLIRNQLLHGVVDERRLTVWGPAVRLEPQMTLHLALMLHELGTNCIKYGALSAPEGRVTISWAVKGRVLRLRWVERGGPAVITPTTRGFGTTLIERSANSEGGSAQMLCEAEGMTWKIALPLPQSIAAIPSADGLASEPVAAEVRTKDNRTTTAPKSLLSGRRFLIVEDESLIALDLAGTLEGAGAEIVGSVGTEREALQIIARTDFEGALLDVNLHGRPVDAIAAALTQRRIPFAFVTGYGRDALPHAFTHVKVLAKPFSPQQLLEMVKGLVPESDNVVQLKP
jgi:PAS domain S-box-containing protein